MMMDVNYTNYGDHFAIYANIESLFCTPKTNMVCVSYTSIKESLHTDFPHLASLWRHSLRAERSGEGVEGRCRGAYRKTQLLNQVCC